MTSSDAHIRIASTGDAQPCLDIYAPFITQSAVSFELEVPTAEAFAERIAQCNRAHRWIVAEQGGKIVGYAYGGPHRARAAYRYSTETSVYIAPAARRSGLGGRLYAALFAELVALGYYHAYAGISMPNAASIALHQTAGFSLIGEFPDVGYKFGTWHSVSWWYRRLRVGNPHAD